MKKTIFLNAGHSLQQPGFVTPSGEKEADLTIAIRNELIPLLKSQGFEVYSVPDGLDLASSIYWVNQKSKDIEDGLALDIHLNAGGGEGVETFYYTGDKSSKEMAQKLQNKFCSYTVMRNRGVKPDKDSAVGKLAWIRDTNCWALLIECGFLDNPTDLLMIKNFQAIAKGICLGILNIYGLPFVEKPQNNAEKAVEEIKVVLKKYNL